MQADRKNIFLDDWRECLRAHYVHVIEIGDAANEKSLREVLISVGVSAAELDAIRYQVTGYEAAQQPESPPEPEAETRPEGTLTPHPLAEAEMETGPADAQAEEKPHKPAPPERFEQTALF